MEWTDAFQQGQFQCLLGLVIYHLVSMYISCYWLWKWRGKLNGPLGWFVLAMFCMLVKRSLSIFIYLNEGPFSTPETIHHVLIPFFTTHCMLMSIWMFRRKLEGYISSGPSHLDEIRNLHEKIFGRR